MLWEVHDYAGYFGLKIALNHLRFRVFWPKVAADIHKHIQDCWLYAKWAMTAWSVPLTPIQTREPYKLMRMDFISTFERFAYGNTYIYNLIDYFLKHMYLYPTAGAGTNDIIFLFDYYL